jgi:ribosomal protein S18 acetylase RimI-like enzyme
MCAALLPKMRACWVLSVLLPTPRHMDILWDRPNAYGDHLQTFSSDAFKLLLSRPDARLWVSETGGTVVGFLSMIIGSVDPVEHRLGGAELPRIYILGPARRMGLGRLLLDAAIRHAAVEGLSHVWLDVMASANWVRHAYLKWGFHEIGRGVFGKPVRPGLSDMVVMTKEVRTT